jgi:hypothetical protein
MSFLSFRRTALILGCGAFGFGLPARAQEFSSPNPTITLPVAPALDSEQPTVTPNLAPSLRLRVSRPALAPRRVAPRVASDFIAPPPDGFGQTPAQLEPWLLGLAKARPRQVTTRILGRTPGGRRIIALEIAPAGVSPWKLKRLAVICRQHGNEPEATASGARFIREFLSSTDPKKRALSQKMALLIVPIANPDGAAVYRRRTDKSVDMNRDWGRYRSVETRVVAQWLASWKPHLMLDVHQWLPDESQPPPMAEASGGALARQTAQRMAQSNRQRGYWLAARSRWGLDTLFHRYWGQRFKIPAILLETRHRPGVPGARDVAIGTSITALWSAVETVSR